MLPHRNPLPLTNDPTCQIPFLAPPWPMSPIPNFPVPHLHMPYGPHPRDLDSKGAHMPESHVMHCFWDHNFKLFFLLQLFLPIRHITWLVHGFKWNYYSCHVLLQWSNFSWSRKVKLAETFCHRGTGWPKICYWPEELETGDMNQISSTATDSNYQLRSLTVLTAASQIDVGSSVWKSGPVRFFDPKGHKP